MSEKMIASEAVYGFAAWLTCREYEIKLGAMHDAAPAVELVKRWCEINQLQPPRDGVYPGNITHPEPLPPPPPAPDALGEPVSLLQCRLCEIDFEHSAISVKLPESIMEKGFIAGNVGVDLTGVQPK